MKEIVNKLHENRQIELAKSILESAGYKVTKGLQESEDLDQHREEIVNFLQSLKEQGHDQYYRDLVDSPADYDEDPDFLEELKNFFEDSTIYIMDRESAVYDLDIISDEAEVYLYNNLEEITGGSSVDVKYGADQDFPHIPSRHYIKIISPLGKFLKAYEWGNSVYYIPENSRLKLVAKLQGSDLQESKSLEESDSSKPAILNASDVMYFEDPMFRSSKSDIIEYFGSMSVFNKIMKTLGNDPYHIFTCMKDDRGPAYAFFDKKLAGSSPVSTFGGFQVYDLEGHKVIKDNEISAYIFNDSISAIYGEQSGQVTEDAGVKVNKNDNYLADDEDIAGSLEYLKSQMYPISQLLRDYGGLDLFSQERDGTEELDIPCDLLGGDYDNVYMISEDDGGAGDVMEIFHDMDREDIKTVHMPGRGYNILVEVPGMGQFVYQNQYGYITLFKKF